MGIAFAVVLGALGGFSRRAMREKEILTALRQI
jgi:hypothetical protein